MRFLTCFALLCFCVGCQHEDCGSGCQSDCGSDCKVECGPICPPQGDAAIEPIIDSVLGSPSMMYDEATDTWYIYNSETDEMEEYDAEKHPDVVLPKPPPPIESVRVIED